MRLELLGISVVFGAAVLVAVAAPRNAGLAGLALTSALNLTGLMNWMMRQTTELEVRLGGRYAGGTGVRRPCENENRAPWQASSCEEGTAPEQPVCAHYSTPLPAMPPPPPPPPPPLPHRLPRPAPRRPGQHEQRGAND